MNTQTRLIICCLLVIIATGMIGIIIGRQEQPDPAATIAMEQNRTERAAISAQKDISLARISERQEQDRSRDRIHHFLISDLIESRGAYCLYFFSGIAGTVSFFGLCLIAFILWKGSQGPAIERKINPRPETCGRCKGLADLPEDSFFLLIRCDGAALREDKCNPFSIKGGQI